MKLSINYAIQTTTDADFELDEDEFAAWCVANDFDPAVAIKQEHRLLQFLLYHLGPEEVSNRLNWNEEIVDIYQAIPIN